MTDPVSWLLVERGWKVFAADGEQIGTVEDAVGDTAQDIFSGIHVNLGRLKPAKFIPAEHVAEIREGEIRLDLMPDEARVREFFEPGERPQARR